IEAWEGDDIATNPKLGPWSAITGDKDHPTDAGRFQIFRKDDKAFSTKYGVPMHWAMFFTADGKAIHQYHHPLGSAGFALDRVLKTQFSDAFGSHGCVRLTESHAKMLFDWTPVGTSVIVTGQ